MINTLFRKSVNLEERLLLFVMIATGLFPVLPNKLKPLPVVLLILLSLWSFIKIPNKKFNSLPLWQPLVLSSLLLVYTVSLIYTEDISTGLKRLETGASLFLAPWLFYFISDRIKLTKTHLAVLCNIYFWAAVVYAVIIIIFFNSIGYYRGEQNLEYCLSWLDGMLWGLSQHAIYASMILGIALLITPFIIKDYRGWKKVLVFIGALLLIYMIFLMFRKGVVVALAVAALVFLIANLKKIKLLSVLAITVLIFVFGFFMKDKISERVVEMFSKESYTQVDVDKSTSMRFTVYNCVIDDIKKNPWIGHGIGDGYDLIETCLDNKYGIVFNDSKLRKNSHNQYLGILLYTGLVGLLLFLFQLLLYIKKAMKTKNILFIQHLLFFSIVLLTENILDRQTGVLLFALFLNLFFFMQLAPDSKTALNE